MSLRSLLKSPTIHTELFRYIIVAGIGLVIDFGTVIFCKEVLGFHYLVAACIGFLLGLVFTYICSNRFVFGEAKGDTKKLFVLFALIGIVGLGLLNVLMWLLTDKLGLNYIISKAAATVVVFAWNFLARKSLYKEEPATV